MGAGVQTFGDHHGDSAAELTHYASVGSHLISGQVMGAAQTAARGAGQVMGQGASGLANALSSKAAKVAGSS